SASPQARATTVSIGAAGTPALVPTTSIQPSGVDSQANYPGPNAEAAQVASSATAAATGVPVFDPRRTAEAAGGLLAQGSTAYPGPTTTTATSPAARSPTANPGATPTRTPALFQPATTVTVSPEVSPTARPTVAQATVAQPTSPPPPPPTQRPPTPIPSPTPVPVDVLRGNIRWTAARSPIRLTR